MQIGFIYQWTDTLTNLKYIGRHEGNIDDGYIGSGTIFVIEYNKRPDHFHREILYEINTSIEDLLAKEEELLGNIPDDELYYGINRKYYNIVRNSSGYTSINNPMKNPEVAARMLATKKIKGNHKTPWQRMVEKYGYEGACTKNGENRLGNKNGEGNKGKPKSKIHKENLSKSLKGRKTDNLNKGGRKSINPSESLINLVEQVGFKIAAEKLETKISALRHRYYRAKKKLEK